MQHDGSADIALYTYGLLDPASDFTSLFPMIESVFAECDTASGFLGRPPPLHQAAFPRRLGEDYGPWGLYALPLRLPDFQGHDPHFHLATLSLWESVQSARSFVYRKLHSRALAMRRDWFLQGPWPGHVLWPTTRARPPHWSDGVDRLERLSREGDAEDHFTFGSSFALKAGALDVHERRECG